MKYKQNKRLRLKNYDYSSPGFYFVTINTKNRQKFFGRIVQEEMILSKIGKIVDKNWLALPSHFENIVLDEFVVMPDHFHGIIINNNSEDAPWRAPTGIQPLQKNSLGLFINHFKGSVKRWCNKNGYPNFCWQSRFHDRIIRDDRELENVRNYIKYNAKKHADQIKNI